MTVDTELRQAQKLFGAVDLLRRAAAELDEDSPTRKELLAHSDEKVAEADPLRVSVVARLFDVDEKTVRKWTGRGLFRRVPASGYVRLDPAGVYATWDLARHLREAEKRHPGLLGEIAWRLESAAIANSAEFQEGLGQYLRGEYEIVRPLPDDSARGDDGGADGPGEAVCGLPARAGTDRV
jgi:hypothetical protein